MWSEPRANFLSGAWRPALRGARFPGASGAPADVWPQSSAEDVALAWTEARAAGEGWRRLAPAAREEVLFRMARALERDERLLARLAARFGVTREELGAHGAGLEEALRALPPSVAAEGVAWCAPDWRELVRAPLVDLARELLAGRTAVLVSDARLPEVGEHLALAAEAAELPPGVFALLHGATRELVSVAHRAGGGADGALVASGSVEGMAELRRLEGHGVWPARLRALRCGAAEVDPARDLAESAREIVEGAFGRGATLGGQLPGALGRVFCPTRLVSRFTEDLLRELDASPAVRAPVRLIDADAAARVRAAWELGLDEGATCIAGGEDAAESLAPAPTVFTNVERYMSSARRQEPLPVLCLLRAG